MQGQASPEEVAMVVGIEERLMVQLTVEDNEEIEKQVFSAFVAEYKKRVYLSEKIWVNAERDYAW